MLFRTLRLPGRIATRRINTDRWDSHRWVRLPYVKCDGPVTPGMKLLSSAGSFSPGKGPMDAHRGIAAKRILRSYGTSLARRSPMFYALHFLI